MREGIANLEFSMRETASVWADVPAKQPTGVCFLNPEP
jgi:hypothetical protein